MQYRPFGNTGIKISTLGFGGMRLPQVTVGDRKEYDHEQGVAVIRRAFELGVNYIDTAPYYCNGESEIIVGKALKDWRDRVYVSTKYPVEKDASGAALRRKLEESLKKLDTDAIDFYHMWSIGWEVYETKLTGPGGPLEQALKAREEGLIRHLSFSFHDDAANLIKLSDTGLFETLLCQYNLLDRSNEAGLAHAHARGLGTVVMGPVGGGRLGAPSRVIADMLPGGARSSAELALRFVISNPHVTCALSGMGTLEMVEQNARVASNAADLSAEEIEAVKAALEQNKKLAELYCTGCNYCMPCPQGIDIPRNFSLMNYHKVYALTQYAQDDYRRLRREGFKMAADCIECGVCEKKCPQKIRIRDQLKETHDTLG